MADSETVTVIRPPGRDPFGDPLPGTAVEFDVPGCLIAPGGSRETGFGENRVDADATIYGPAGMDVLATDRVRIRGRVYAVVGEPQNWGSDGTAVAVRHSSGA